MSFFFKRRGFVMVTLSRILLSCKKCHASKNMLKYPWSMSTKVQWYSITTTANKNVPSYSKCLYLRSTTSITIHIKILHTTMHKTIHFS